jgi:hypothetical protein
MEIEMINKIKAIKAELSTRCALAGVPYSGNYPEDIAKVGNRFPIVLFESLNLESLKSTNNVMNPVYTVSVILITQSGVIKTDVHENIVFDILNQVYKDNNLSGACTLTEPQNVQFNAEIPLITSAYQSDAIQCSRIDFQITYNDKRHIGA